MNKALLAGIFFLALLGGMILASVTGCDVQDVDPPDPRDPPSPIVQECPTEEQALYFKAMGKNFTERGEYLQAIGGLIDQASNDTSFVYDNDWRSETATMLIRLVESIRAIEEIDPADSVHPIHHNVLDIGDLQREAAILYAQGLDDLDADKIILANERLETAAEYLWLINDQMETFCDR